MNFYRVTIECRAHGAIGEFQHKSYDVIAYGRDDAAKTAMHDAHADAWETRSPVSIESRDENEIDVMTKHYILCALWSSCDEFEQPLDAVYTPSDVSPDAWADARSACADFVGQAREIIESLPNWYGAHPDCGKKFPKYAAAGHDFWLTRNGHGAGFWDRGLNDAGGKLTDMCVGYNGVDMYVGDDGNIHAQ